MTDSAEEICEMVRRVRAEVESQDQKSPRPDNQVIGSVLSSCLWAYVQTRLGIQVTEQTTQLFGVVALATAALSLEFPDVAQAMLNEARGMVLPEDRSTAREIMEIGLAVAADFSEMPR